MFSFDLKEMSIFITETVKKEESKKVFECTDDNEEMEIDPNLPEHEFVQKYIPYSSKNCPKNGSFRWVSTLIVEPYVYTVIRNRDDRQDWQCSPCLTQKHRIGACSEIVGIGPNGKPKLRLKSVDTNHICNASPDNHLHTKFMNSLQNAIVQDPASNLQVLYDKFKEELCQTLDSEMRELFLSRVKPFATMSRNLYRLQKSLVPQQGRYRYSCELCEFQAANMDEYKTHKKKEHRGIKPHQCSTCGKVFGSKSNLATHEARGHKTFKENSITVPKIQEQVPTKVEDVYDEPPPSVIETDAKGLPPHSFSYKYTPFMDGPLAKENKQRWIVTLIIKPYVFTKYAAKNDDSYRWYCLKCNDEGCRTYAVTQETIGPDGKPHHELISVDSNHVCNPCPSYHLKRIFRDQLNNMILADPLITVPEAYDTIKNQMCESLDFGLQKLFLENIQALDAIENGLLRMRRKFAKSSEGDNFVCELCSYQTCDSKSMRKHRNEKHPEDVKSLYKCEVCGKGFLRKENFVVHSRNVHKICNDEFGNLKIFPCDQCNYVSASIANLRKHVNAVHEKLTPHECEICQKRFSLKSHLKRHLKNVHKSTSIVDQPLYV